MLFSVWSFRDENILRFMYFKKFKKGDVVRLVHELTDTRPVRVRGAGPDSCILEDKRAGYFCWNNGDLQLIESTEEKEKNERHNKTTMPGG